MMTKTVTWILIVNILTGYCESKTKSVTLNGRVNILERRLNQEINARSHDVATIYTKIEEIDQKINETLEIRDLSTLQDGDNERCQGLDVSKQSQALAAADIEKLKSNIATLYRAFEKEKRIDVETRSTLPGIKTELELCDSRLTEMQSKHDILKEENQMLKEMLENVTEDIANRFMEVHEKIEMLVFNNTSHQKQIQNTKMEEEGYSSCKNALNNGRRSSGVYKLRRKQTGQTIQVYCDQTTNNGGWIVFQRRVDGSEDFYRNWSDYKNGFGNLEKEFWLGNDFIHEITADKEHELRIDMEDVDGNTAYAEYRTFKINSEKADYKLKVNGYRGSASDNLKFYNNAFFFTKDRDNVVYSSDTNKSTAKLCRSAWWFYGLAIIDCYMSNLNGVYKNDKNLDSLAWYFSKLQSRKSLKFVEMKTRAKENETL